MHICMLVTSNVIKDPRVQKEAQLATEHGMQVTVIGRVDKQFDQEPLKTRPYDVLLIPVLRKENDGLFGRVIERSKFLHLLYKHCIELHPDVIHANDFDTLPCAFYAGKKLGVPVIYDSHEIWSENGSVQRIKPLKWGVQRYERFLARRVAGIVSVSNAAADKLAQIHHIPRPEVITNCPYSFCARNEIQKNAGFEVLYHGIFNRGRGYEEFCLSAHHLTAPITLILRGFGPSEPDLRRLVIEHDLYHRVRFDDPVSVAEMTSAAARSHVGAVLTRPVNVNFKYTVSNKIFEYIQAGLPVIMSDVPEHRYLNEKFNIGLIVDEVTPLHIAQAVQTLYDDPQLFSELRKNVLKAAESLCWEQEGLKLLNIYREAFAAKKN